MNNDKSWQFKKNFRTKFSLFTPFLALSEKKTQKSPSHINLIFTFSLIAIPLGNNLSSGVFFLSSWLKRTVCIKQNHNNEWMYGVWLVKRRRTMAYWPGLLYYWTEPALSLLQGRRKWRGNRPPPRFWPKQKTFSFKKY